MMNLGNGVVDFVMNWIGTWVLIDLRKGLVGVFDCVR